MLKSVKNGPNQEPHSSNIRFVIETKMTFGGGSKIGPRIMGLQTLKNSKFWSTRLIWDSGFFKIFFRLWDGVMRMHKPM